MPLQVLTENRHCAAHHAHRTVGMPARPPAFDGAEAHENSPREVLVDHALHHTCEVVRHGPGNPKTHGAHCPALWLAM